MEPEIQVQTSSQPVPKEETPAEGETPVPDPEQAEEPGQTLASRLLQRRQRRDDDDDLTQ